MSGSSTTGAFTTRAITNNTSATAVTASTNLITANTLYYHKGNSNITTVGTITSGTWQGTKIGASYLPTASTTAAGIIQIGTGSGNAMAGNTTVTNVAFTAATDNAEYPILIKNSTGSTTTAASAKFANTTNKLTTINPSTGTITAPAFKGALTGNVTGNVSGTASNVTGTVAIANGGTGTATTDAHEVLIGPSSGSAAAPSWRILAAADLPTATTSALGIMKVGTGLGVSSGVVSVSYGTTSNTALQGNQPLLNLNGSAATAASPATFYAPTAAGTSGQVLVSSGTGAPVWTDNTGGGKIFILEAKSILGEGDSQTWSDSRITTDCYLLRWNFSASPENNPPVMLSWATTTGQLTVTNNGGTTDETIMPILCIPE